MVKVELRAYNQVYDISNSIANIDDIEVSLDRDGIDAVFKKTTFDFEFVGEAYDIIDNIFNAHRQFTLASIYVYIRNNDFSYTTDYEQYDLDFLTFSKTDDVISISSRDKTLASIIKAKKGIVYDIPVVEVKDLYKWAHRGIELFNSAVSAIDSVAEMPPREEYGGYSQVPQWLRWNSDLVSVGGSYLSGDIILKDYLTTGKARPPFYTRDVEWDEIFLWECISPIRGTLKIKARGIIMGALGFNNVPGYPQDYGSSDLILTVDIRTSIYNPDNTLKEVISFWTGSTRDLNFKTSSITANHIIVENGYNDLVLPATFALKVGGVGMPDCFPQDEELPPLEDKYYEELGVPQEVSLSVGETIRIQMKLFVNDLTGSIVFNSSSISYFNPYFFPYLREQSDIISPRGQEVDNAPVVHPLNTPETSKFFFRATDFRYDRTSWLDGKITFDYLASMPMTLFDVIRPEIVLQRLINNMTRTNNQYDAIIDYMNLNSRDMDMLVAGESLIPNFKSPVLHTSYTDVANWLFTLGYTERITRKGVQFSKRWDAFNSNITALDLTDTECEDLEQSIDESRIYSSTKVGYNKQTYEGENARLEFNGEHEYDIDEALTTNVLNITTKYRADSLGLELKWIKLVRADTRSTASTDSDKDVFVVNLELNNDRYNQIVVQFETGDNNGQYNWKYNPRYILENNLDLLASSGLSAMFASSSANPNYSVINEKEEIVELKGDIDFGRANIILSSLTYDLAIGTHKPLPHESLWSGIVKFMYRGKILEGYIAGITKNINQEQEVQYKLFAKYDGWKEELIPRIESRDVLIVEHSMGIYSIGVRVVRTLNPTWIILDMSSHGLIVHEDTDFISTLFLEVHTNNSFSQRELFIDIASEDYKANKRISIIQNGIPPFLSTNPSNTIYVHPNGENNIWVEVMFNGVEKGEIEIINTTDTSNPHNIEITIDEIDYTHQNIVRFRFSVTPNLMGNLPRFATLSINLLNNVNINTKLSIIQPPH